MLALACPGLPWRGCPPESDRGWAGATGRRYRGSSNRGNAGGLAVPSQCKACGQSDTGAYGQRATEAIASLPTAGCRMVRCLSVNLSPRPELPRGGGGKCPVNITQKYTFVKVVLNNGPRNYKEEGRRGERQKGSNRTCQPSLTTQPNIYTPRTDAANRRATD